MSYDLAVVGAGPGGYVAAIRAAQLGAKVALIERDEVGGVCLNHGCIPTKTMIASAHVLRVVHSAPEFGIDLPAFKAVIDMTKVHARKCAVVAKLRSGVTQLLKGQGVEILRGNAAFSGSAKLNVDGNSIDAKNIIIATGSTWIDVPTIAIDGKVIVTSDEALEWTSVPEKIVIIGGGVVGCEFACLMRAFGAEVTIVEATSSILPPIEKAISRLLSRTMKEQGIEILTDTTVVKAVSNNANVQFTLSGGEERTADKMIVAAGRRASVASLGLAAAGVLLTERGFIKVDSDFKTSADNICAIGDVIGHPMLAHAASAEGIAAVEGMFAAPSAVGASIKYDPKICPSPIFTIPEIASVGLTSEELKARNVTFTTGRFPYAASGKALCDGESEGQVIVHAAESGEILGAHIIGREAATMIAEASLAVKYKLAAHDVAQTIHSHPTLPEMFAEACEDAKGMAIHKVSFSKA